MNASFVQSRPPLAPPERLLPPPPPERLTPREKTAPAQKPFWRRAVREIAETLVLTLIAFVLIRALIQNFRIEGASMEPNFHDGQFLIVDKVSYHFQKPQRGDVVVFVFPNNPARDFIKRIVGLPGDRIQVVHGQVNVNGQWIAEPYPLNPGTYFFSEAVVGDDELFVLGDNRNYSSDSHTWGMLPMKNVIGKAWASYWPAELIGWVQTYSFAAAK